MGIQTKSPYDTMREWIEGRRSSKKAQTFVLIRGKKIHSERIDEKINNKNVINWF